MFSLGDPVVSNCYSNPIAWVEVQNPSNNAWTGLIQYSTNAGETFGAMLCSDALPVIKSGNPSWGSVSSVDSSYFLGLQGWQKLDFAQRA